MPSNTCEYCGHNKRAYYAQVISNGKKVVAQRCAACLRSWKGQPFVSVIGFDWNSLPRWNDDGTQSQPELQVVEQPAPPPKGRAPIGTVGYTERIKR